MMNASANTALSMCGATVLKFLTFWPSQLSLMKESSASMVACLLQLLLLMKSDRLTASRKFPMTAPCATWCGVTQMISLGGWYLLVVQDIYLVVRSLKNSIERIGLIWLRVPISLWWKATSQCSMIHSWLCGLRLTIATVAEMWLPFSNLTKTLKSSIRSLKQLLRRSVVFPQRSQHPTISCE